jgi:hypothetical protein
MRIKFIFIASSKLVCIIDEWKVHRNIKIFKKIQQNYIFTNENQSFTTKERE